MQLPQTGQRAGYDGGSGVEEAVNGRPAYVLQATPHAGYYPQGKYGKMFSNVEGKLWVDKQDLGCIKVDGQVIQPFSIGLFLARVLSGSHITMEQTRVDDGIWMPERVEVRAAANGGCKSTAKVQQISGRQAGPTMASFVESAT